jgi:hypothetical protein
MNRQIKKWGIIAGLAGGGAALLDALLLEKYFFEVKTFNIGKKGSKQKIKLLLLTDLHFRKALWPFHKKLAKKINSIHPDLILISGDVIDESGTDTPAQDFFSLINYSIPKVAILGNHDHKNSVRIDTYKRLYEQNNCKLLINESKLYTIKRERVMVTGVDDFIEGNASFATAVKDVGREENHVLLVHSPLQQEVVLKEMKRINDDRNDDKKLNIQYIFAGHNHGGQVNILGYAPILPEKSGPYLKGWYNKKAPYLYVSKGFGTSTLPFRFGARSEVTVFNMGV